jgi:sodium/proline symporter
MGLTEIWTALGCVTGIITAWALIAWRMRDLAEKYNVTTFTGYLSLRYGEAGRTLRIISSLAIVFFFFFYVGAQFLGGGKTLHTMFGISPSTGVILTAAIIIPYTVYGGFRSVVYTDVIQSLLMIITLIVGPIAGLIYIATTPGLFASGIGEALQKSGESYLSITGAAKGFGAGLMIMGGFSWFFGYLGGQPQLSVRFMAIKDQVQARKARNIGIAWTVIAYLGALTIGWIGIAIFGPAGLKDPEYVMPSVMLRLFPPVLAGLMITGAIAAMVSTADSLLILSATELSENLLGKKTESAGGNSGKDILVRHRFTTAVLAVVALGLSFITPSKLIFTIVSYVWAGIGCTFSVVVLFSLFWDRFHERAALLTVAGGILFTILWISGGFEQHYRVSVEKAAFLEQQDVIDGAERKALLELEGRKFISSSAFSRAVDTQLSDSTERDIKIAKVVTAFTVKGVPARLCTFFFALSVALLSTFLVPARPSRPSHP